MSIGVRDVAGALTREQIEPGIYELVAHSWDELIDHGAYDPATGKRNLPVTYKRHVTGDLVKLDVHEARRLYLAGAVVLPGEREQAALAAAESSFVQVKGQQEAARARLEAAQQQLLAADPDAAA